MLDGALLKGNRATVTNDIHKICTEIVGGFVLLKADDLHEAIVIMQSCPIFAFDGYAEIWEMQQ